MRRRRRFRPAKAEAGRACDSSNKWAQLSTVRTVSGVNCTGFGPCLEATWRLGFRLGTWQGAESRISRFAHESGQNFNRQMLIAQGDFPLSTGEGRCLAGRCRECEGNTISCGLLLTCTTGSGIFSSAAVNWLFGARCERATGGRAAHARSLRYPSLGFPVFRFNTIKTSAGAPAGCGTTFHPISPPVSAD